VPSSTHTHTLPRGGARPARHLSRDPFFPLPPPALPMAPARLALAVPLLLLGAAAGGSRVVGGREAGGAAPPHAADRPPPPPPVLASPACVRHANALATGPCRDWQAAATRLGAGVADAECGALHALALGLPPPDDACCADARAFVEGGCGCDADVGRLAGMGGFGADTPRGGARLASVTRCADPAVGGRMFVNPCGGNCMPMVAGGAAPGAAAAAPAPPAPVAPGPVPQYGALGAAPRAAAPAAAETASGDALVLNPGAAAGAGGAAAAQPAAATAAPTAAPAAAGAAAARAPLPNINAMLGIVGPGMLSSPVTPGQGPGAG